MLRTPLERIWNESSLLRLLGDHSKLTGKCGLCEYKKVCMGCRARAYGELGDYLAAEPFCDYLPKRLRTENKE